MSTAQDRDAVAHLESTGWDRILRVEEEDEQVYLFARESEGMIVGFTVLVGDPDPGGGEGGFQLGDPGGRLRQSRLRTAPRRRPDQNRSLRVLRP